METQEFIGSLGTDEPFEIKQIKPEEIYKDFNEIKPHKIINKNLNEPTINQQQPNDSNLKEMKGGLEKDG